MRNRISAVQKKMSMSGSVCKCIRKSHLERKNGKKDFKKKNKIKKSVLLQPKCHFLQNVVAETLEMCWGDCQGA